MIYHADFETFSEADLPEVGAFAYAEHPSTEAMLCAVASESAGPFLWVHPKWRHVLPSDPRADALFCDMAESDDALVYAHEAQFERAIARYVDTPLRFMRERPRQWRCTKAMCRRAAIPDSLEKSTAYLGLSQQKDSKGKKLIKLFSSLQKDGTRITPEMQPEKFREFGEYCLQDVRAEMALHKKLRNFEMTGFVLETFLLDIHLNDRGVPVDVGALRQAKRVVDELLADVGEKFRALTGIESTRRAAVQEWFNANGVELENMQRDTVLEAIEKHPNNEALRLYSELQFAAVKKVNAFLAYANSDGRMRGTMKYHGTGPGRWASTGPQIQNLKKPTIKNTEAVYDCLAAGFGRDDIDLLFGNPLEAIASSIRHFIRAPHGPILDADYAGLQARVVCWLAGQEDALQRYRDGVDSYKLQAAMIYNTKPELIGQKSRERQLGKTTILGAGFQMGGATFLDTCHLWGLDWVTEHLAIRAVQSYRAMHQMVVRFWYATEDAAINAIVHPGKLFRASKIAFDATRSHLRLILPSGREIHYAEPKVEYDPKFKKNGITFYGLPPLKSVWGRCRTFSGRLVENATMGVEADIMAHGGITCLHEGFDPFMFVHDQACAEKHGNQTAKAFADALTRLPKWAEGLPLVAEGEEVRVFTK